MKSLQYTDVFTAEDVVLVSDDSIDGSHHGVYHGPLKRSPCRQPYMALHSAPKKTEAWFVVGCKLGNT